MAAEFRAMGVVFTSETPSGKDWLPCHAIDREDRKASAAVNLESGYYRDLGGEGRKLSFWDFAVRFGKFGDWKDALRHFADKTGIMLPRGGQSGQYRTSRLSAIPLAAAPVGQEPPKSATASDRPAESDSTNSVGIPPAIPPAAALATVCSPRDPRQFLLDLAELVVIGEYAGKEIEVYSRSCRKVVRFESIEKLTFIKLIQLCGDPAYRFYPGYEPVSGKQSFQALRETIALYAGRTDLSRTGTLGQGIWRAGGRIVIVNGGTAAAVADGGLTEISHPRIQNDILDFSATEPWVDFATLNLFLANAGDLNWCREVISEATALFANWNWKHPRDAGVAALLAACSFTQTLWAWRPEVAITGPSDCGKSTLLEMLSALFGRLKLYVSKPTEAGLRQCLANTARIMMIDEFENSEHRQRILEMLRTTSQGGFVIRGTSDQKGKGFRICHIPWMAAIETGLTQAADRNRFIILDLAAIPVTKRGRLVLPGDLTLGELGLKLCAVVLRHTDRIMEMFKILKGSTFDGVHGRLVENFALPAALLAVVNNQDDDNARLTLGDLLSGREQLARQGGGDEKDLLHAIFGSQYQVGGGVVTSVSTTLTNEIKFSQHSQTLASAGVSLCPERPPASRPPADWCARWWREGKLTHIFLDTDKVKRFLLRGTRWENLDIEQLLLRVRGATRQKRLLAGTRTWGILIPKAETDLDDGCEM